MKKNTVDFEHAKYSRSLIRQYEDPEYVKKAEEYERQAKAEKARKAGRQAGSPGGSTEGPSRTGRKNSFSYEDYLNARADSKGKHSRGGQPTVRKVDPRYEPAARAARRQARMQKKRRKKGGCLKMFFLLLLILIVATVAVLGYNIWDLTSSLDRIDTDGQNFAIDSGVEESLSDYRNIAILGSDARKGEGYDGSRTDAILVLSINKKTGESRLISVMRDSYLKIDGPDGDLILDKVTHAHAYGGGMGTTRALNRNLDLNVKEFVIFNWQAVSDTVDTLGGIEVDVKKNELKDLNHYGKETGKNVGKKFHKVKEPGLQTLDGVQATTYCRIRKNSGGDTGRAGRYKKVVEGVMKKMIANPMKAKELSDTVMPQIRTNMTRIEVTTLMGRLARMDMKKGIAWPKSYYGGIVRGVWYAVPTTLNSNVKRLHKKAFGQEDYESSKTSRRISKEIVKDTGYE